MKSFKRKFAAFMAVVLALTSFNMAWAAKSARTVSNEPLRFSEDSGSNFKNSFELETGGAAKVISVSVATPSDANLKVTNVKVKVASGSNADAIATVATPSDATLTISPVGEGSITVEVTAKADTSPATRSNGSGEETTFTGTFTVVVVKGSTSESGRLVCDNTDVTITAGDPEVTITVSVEPEGAEMGMLSVESTYLEGKSDGLTIEAHNPATGPKTITIETTRDVKSASGYLIAHATVNGEEKEARINVTINAVVVSGSLEFLPGEFTLRPGEIQSVHVSATPSNAALTDLAVDMTGITDLKVTELDQDNNTFNVSALDTFTSKTQEIPVSAKVNGVPKTGTIKVTIKAYEPDDDKVTSITISFNGDPDQEYYVGQHIIATAQILPEGLHPDYLSWEPSGIDCQMSGTDVPYTMDFLAQSAGTLTIKATVGKVSNTASVKVNPISANMKFTQKSVAISNKGTYDFNEDLDITVTKPATGDLHDDILSGIKSSVRFESSDKDILTVDENGLGTALKPGIVTVKATAPANHMTAECKVLVADDNTYQIVLDKTDLIMEDVNLIQKITADVYAAKDNEAPVKVVDLEKAGIQLTWTTSDKNVVTVDKMGMVTSMAKGSAVVTATITNKEGKEWSQTCEVTVKKVASVNSGDVENAYKNDADVTAVLADPTNVKPEQAKAAANKVTNSIQSMTNGNTAALLKNEAETAKVMNDVATIEQALFKSGAIIEKTPVVNTNKIKGIEADGLAMNALANGMSGALLEVKDDTSVAKEDIPQAVGGRTVDSSFVINIGIAGIEGKLEVPVRIKLTLPGGYTAANTGIIHYGVRGTEIVPCTVSGGKVIFTVGDLSPFAIVKLQGGPGGNNTPTYSGGSSSSTKTVKAAPSIPETPGFWFATAAGWQFYTPEGILYVNTWIYVGGQWYWVDATGTMNVGWTQINGKMYYMNPANGAMQVGWIAIAEQNTWYYTDASGAMVTGWQQISGKWYYFDANGAMLANANTPDGYYVNADGVWVQ